MPQEPPPALTEDQINHAWLSDVLCEPVTIRDRQTLSAGYISDVFRIHFQTAGTLRTIRSVIVKTASQDPVKRQFAIQFMSYQREHRFYAGIAPKLPINTPGCYYNHFQEKPLSFCLVLEDVSDASAYPDHQAAARPIDQAIAKQMARLHQSHWNRAAGLPVFTQNLMQIGASYKTVLERQAGSARHLLGDVAYPVVRDTVHHGFQAQQPEPSTLIHVDFKPDNFSLKNGLTLFDWGDYCFGPPSFDLAYFMMHATPFDNLASRHDLGLPETYHKSLRKLGIVDYPLEQLHLDLKHCLPLLAFTPLALMETKPDAAKTAQLGRCLKQLGQMIDLYY